MSLRPTSAQQPRIHSLYTLGEISDETISLLDTVKLMPSRHLFHPSNILHLHTPILMPSDPCRLLGASSRSKSLVPLLVTRFELKIGGWLWSHERRNPVDNDVSRSERPIPIFLAELVRIEIFACCLPSSEQPKVVAPEAGWIARCEDPVDEHGEWNPIDSNGFVERNMIGRGVS